MFIILFQSWINKIVENLECS